MFCSIHDFPFLMTDTKIKGQVSFEFSEKKKLLPAQFSVKFIILPAQSIVLANWFTCVPACISTIAQVSLISLKSMLFVLNSYFSSTDSDRKLLKQIIINKVWNQSTERLLFLPSWEQFKSILYPSVTIDISETNKKLYHTTLSISLEGFSDDKYCRAIKVPLERTNLQNITQLKI